MYIPESRTSRDVSGEFRIYNLVSDTMIAMKNHTKLAQDQLSSSRMLQDAPGGDRGSKMCSFTSADCPPKLRKFLRKLVHKMGEKVEFSEAN